MHIPSWCSANIIASHAIAQGSIPCDGMEVVASRIILARKAMQYFDFVETTLVHFSSLPCTLSHYGLQKEYL
jgi:hypothetical protein